MKNFYVLYSAPYPVEKKVPYPVKVPVHVPQPYPVEKVSRSFRANVILLWMESNIIKI